MKIIHIYVIQFLFILTTCTFCQLDSLASKSTYIGFSSYLPYEDSGRTTRGPQIISGGIHYKPFGNRLTISIEIGGDPIATYFSSRKDTTRTSKLAMAIDSTINNISTTTFITGTVLHMFTSTPLQIDFRKVYAFIEPGFEIIYDGRTLHQINQYSHYNQNDRSFTEYARDTSEIRKLSFNIKPMFKIGFGIYWKQFQISLNNYNFISIGLSLYWNFKTNTNNHNP